METTINNFKEKILSVTEASVNPIDKSKQINDDENQPVDFSDLEEILNIGKHTNEEI